MSQNKNYNIDWGELFCLDTKSPSGLVRTKNRVGKNIPAYPIGTKVFYEKGAPRAYTVRFKKTVYYVHRIIWVMTYGSIDPDLVIDHLDGNPFNNSIENLTLKVKADNSRNRRKHSNNTAGITGVMLTNSGKGNLYYTAFWNDNGGVQKKKHFSISNLGEETAKQLATTYRTEQLQKLIDQGVDYTERHGN